MAKFTVFFNNKPILSKIFESGVVHIGRDETNAIQIDSLAIAPAHAAVIIGEHGCSIKQLNDSFPLFVNQEKTKDHPLNDGDKITMGKHVVVYHITETIAPVVNAVNKDVAFLNEKIGSTGEEPEANLQILSGKHIGRVIPIKKSMTKLGHSGSGIAIISRRKDGFFISALESSPSMKVNNSEIGENTIKLNKDDIVELNDVSMMFYSE